MDNRQEKLVNASRAMGLVLTPEQVFNLLKYMDLLKKWNKTYNLTALKTDEQILAHHILDSLSVVKPLQEKCILHHEVSVLDVGSGGGLPGVVLAIMNEGWQVECIDAVQKKTSFIMLVAGALALNNLKSKHVRIEKYTIKPVDLVISRAFASLVDFANLAGKHVAEQGYLVAMKGRYLEEEVQALAAETQWYIESYLPLNVPLLEAERCLMYLKPRGNLIG